MDHLDEIFKRYLNNTCTKEELHIILHYFESRNHSEELENLVQKELLKPDKVDALSAKLAGIVKKNRFILEKKLVKSENRYSKKIMVKWISVAASLLLFSSILIFFLENKKHAGPIQTLAQQDIPPGGNRASLILSSGTVIPLREDQNTIIMDGRSVTYKDGSSIISSDTIQYITLLTPRKGQYQVTLPDGSKVWLNAASSIRYPTVFPSSLRQVELKGEAYFQVAHNRLKPFVVKSKGQILTVLGTEFNVNAYDNESATATTLFNGRVMLASLDRSLSKVLKPNQQALLAGSKIDIRDVDVKTYGAWREGEFRFKATPLPEVLRQLERWYDLDVNYDNIPNNIKIHASIRKNRNLSSVLYALEKISNVKLVVKGRRLERMR